MDKEFFKAMIEIEEVFEKNGVRWITDPGKERGEFHKNAYEYLTASDDTYKLLAEQDRFEEMKDEVKNKFEPFELFEVDDAVFRVANISRFKEKNQQIEGLALLPDLIIQNLRFYFGKISGTIQLHVICWIDEMDEIRDSEDRLWEDLEKRLEEKTSKQQRLERMYNPELKEKQQRENLVGIIEPIKKQLIESEFSRKLQQQITKSLIDWRKEAIKF